MKASQKPPTLLLEQLALGELPPDSERDLRAEYGSDRIDACLAELRDETTRSLKENPPEAFEARLLMRLKARSTRPMRNRNALAKGLSATLFHRVHLARAFAGTALAMVMGLGLWVSLNREIAPQLPEMAKVPSLSNTSPKALSQETSTPESVLDSQPALSPSSNDFRIALADDPALPDAEVQPSADPGIRFKGDELQLLGFVQKSAEVRPLRTGDTVCSGQFLQLHYLTTEPGFGIILSIDGRGNTTHHLPQGLHATTQATLLTPRSVVPLPHSYELDQAPHFERFFFFMASEPFTLRDIEPALQRYQMGVVQSSRDPRRRTLARSAKLTGLPKRVRATSLLLMKGCGE